MPLIFPGTPAYLETNSRGGLGRLFCRSLFGRPRTLGFPRENSTRAAVGLSRFSPSHVLRQSRSYRLWRHARRNHDFGGSLYYLAREYRRPVTLTHGTNVLVGSDSERIMHEFARVLTGMREAPSPPQFWDGSAAKRIIQTLIENEMSTATLKMTPSTESTINDSSGETI